MPQILSRPPYRAAMHIASVSDSGEAQLTAILPSRRWPIWSARLALVSVAVAAVVLLRSGLSHPEGRETLVMSALAAVVVITIFVLWAHDSMKDVEHIPRTRLVRRIVTIGASMAAVGIFLMGAQACPDSARTKRSHAPKQLWPSRHGDDDPAIHPEHVDLLPRFSAKLDGESMSPVSLVFLGSGSELLDTFQAAGWHVADRVTVETALRAFARGVLNRPYPNAPVLPVFLDGKLHDVAFQKHEEGDSSRRRHHSRWWLTDYECDGRQVWVATASFDAGVGIGRLVPLPIHHIDPDIDAERDYIVHSLVATGRVGLSQRYRVTEPMVGRNAAGDRFFTSGIACVLS